MLLVDTVDTVVFVPVVSLWHDVISSQHVKVLEHEHCAELDVHYGSWKI